MRFVLSDPALFSNKPQNNLFGLKRNTKYSRSGRPRANDE